MVEVDDVLVQHPNAAGGNVPADSPWLVCAMDPVESVFVTLPKIQSTSAQWIGRTPGHTKSALQCAHLAHELGLPLHHFFGWVPVRPFLLIADCGDAGPTKALPTYADAIANRASVSLYRIKKTILYIDDDGAQRFSRRVMDRPAKVARIYAPIDADGLLLQIRVQSARARSRLTCEGRLKMRFSRTLA